MSSLIFLKLGGSLITAKNSPHTARLEVIERLAREIAAGWRKQSELRLVIGHGSGSFGHVAAHRYQTRQGVHTPEQWQGYAEVWHEARLLNQIVIESLYNARLPVVAFPPSAGAVVSMGKVEQWDISALQAALSAHLIPVVNGDVAIDRTKGGTIVSTEDVFVYLSKALRPDKILLAGIEPGVWGDYPACTRLLPFLTPADRVNISGELQGSSAVDVTGGMADKVNNMLELAQTIPHLEVMIFSGEPQGQVEQALGGAVFGTLLRPDRFGPD